MVKHGVVSNRHLVDQNNDMNEAQHHGMEHPRSKQQSDQMIASIGDTLSFAFSYNDDDHHIAAGSVGTTMILFLLGWIGAIGNGLVYPALTFLLSHTFNQMVNVQTNGIAKVRDLAYQFMVVGVLAFLMASMQTWCFEIVAYRASRNLRLQWFRALLRQDVAFYDIYYVSGLASTTIGTNATQYRRGMGRKLGEGIQFFTTAVGGIAYGFYTNWRTALITLAVLPIAATAALAVIHVNQTKDITAAKAYQDAGTVAYTTVSSIRTLLSLNAIPQQIRLYTKNTSKAYLIAARFTWKQGAAYGLTYVCFTLFYIVLTLFGTFLITRDVQETGCDPSGGVPGNVTCQQSGASIFGAMFAVSFAAQSCSLVGNSLEAFTEARVAVVPALHAIRRKPGAPKQIIYDKPNNDDGGDDDDDDGGDEPTTTLREDATTITTSPKIKAILPTYIIDSSSDTGLKPSNIKGDLTFHNVEFAYPSRPGKVVLENFSLTIPAGSTFALVGPSGGGKSTIAALIERFYDPQRGTVKLDGVDMKAINVKYLRGLIGYVGQEPTLFATSIAGNIQYGNAGATQDQIEEAARRANAHDFITSFPDGYNTQVGHEGAQLSGGQKQRIAIARALVGNPSILLLDEATSALDTESELVVQEALDNVVAEHQRTTIIIAHRLSTIRHASIIAVIADKHVVEIGTHEQLMLSDLGHYRNLVRKQDKTSNSAMSSKSNSYTDLSENCFLEEAIGKAEEETCPSTNRLHVQFKNVTFAYPSRPTKLVFKGMNLSISEGETVALVGPSGGGKSTAAALIERFYDALDGTVEYFGHDIKSLNLKWYRDQIGYVGQEPTLFNDTIARNIAYGSHVAVMEDIVKAAKLANAHDFILSFPDGYNTRLGERSQLSGGQKQRVAIARVLVRKPKVLVLDEATSALDSDSEAVVQAALDKIMASRDHTTIVIAHRLSTIRNADKIAFVEDGVVKEFGSHDELLTKPQGRYKRLVDSQIRNTALHHFTKPTADAMEDEPDRKFGLDDNGMNAFQLARARKMASPDAAYLLVGAIGSVMVGGMFPLVGILLGQTIDILFRPILYCSDDNNVPIPEYSTCADYWGSITHNLHVRSYKLTVYWFIVGIQAFFGYILVFRGFGLASERLNKRLRDNVFSALVRQEVGFFDQQSVGSLTSQLQDDAARIQAFSGEPIRSFLIAVSSIITGVTVSLVYMWPLALVFLACVPVMAFATSIEMLQMLGDDCGRGQDELNSPGGIVIETLVNIRTVSSLTMEQQRYDDYANCLQKAEPNHVQKGFVAGVTSGSSMLVQQWVNALTIWWGGYLLFHYPDQFSFQDFLTSNMALLFSLFGIGAAFQGLSDRKQTEKSAERIFYLLDRKSSIDPLIESGNILE